jgi:hypothetical protein
MLGLKSFRSAAITLAGVGSPIASERGSIRFRSNMMERRFIIGNQVRENTGKHTHAGPTREPVV